MIAMWCILDKFIFLYSFLVCLIFVINYIAVFKIYRVCFGSEGACVSHTALFLFQSFTRILVYHKSANKSALYTYFLLHCNTLCKISRLIDIQTLSNRNIISQKLQRNHCQAAHEMLIYLRHIHSEVHLILNLLESIFRNPLLHRKKDSGESFCNTPHHNCFSIYKSF